MEIKRTVIIDSLHIKTYEVNGNEYTEFECTGDFDDVLTDLSILVNEVSKQFKKNPVTIAEVILGSVKNDFFEDKDSSKDSTKVIAIKPGDIPELDEIIQEFIANKIGEDEKEGEVN